MAAPATPPFQAFTITLPGRASRILTDALVCIAFDPKNPPDPLPQMVQLKGLWDTGATKSVISSDVARQLGLVPTGTVKVNHAGGVSQSPTYVISLFLPNRVALPGVLVSECPPQPGFDLIIGMDVITLGDLAITNVGGKTSFSFRIPSVETVSVPLVRPSTTGATPPSGQGQAGAGGSPP